MTGKPPVRVPQFLPFRALRYSTQHDLAQVTAPPYDVLSAADREALAALTEHNIVTLDLPIGDDPYNTAATALAQWRSDDVVVLDPKPSFTLYRMRFTDASGETSNTDGVFGALEVVDEGAGGQLPHERT
ncbi:MAG: DUF1015 family protein, partial [Actinomycetota bacterium]